MPKKQWPLWSLFFQTFPTASSQNGQGFNNSTEICKKKIAKLCRNAILNWYSFGPTGVPCKKCQLWFCEF